MDDKGMGDGVVRLYRVVPEVGCGGLHETGEGEEYY